MQNIVKNYFELCLYQRFYNKKHSKHYKTLKRKKAWQNKKWKRFFHIYALKLES